MTTPAQSAERAATATTGAAAAPIVVIGEVVCDAVAAQPAASTDETDTGRAAVTPSAARQHTVQESLGLTVHPGGSPANTAVALARLGSVSRFGGRLSTGSLGQLCRRHLEASRVDLAAAIRTDEPATLAIATLAADGGASYEFYVDGTADWQWTAAELDATLTADAPTAGRDTARVSDSAPAQQPVAIHTGSLALAIQPGAREIESFLLRSRDSATISIDPNVRLSIVPVDTYRQRIEHWAALADLMKFSDEDLTAIWPDRTPAEAARVLHGHGTRLVVVTRGGDGVFASLLRGNDVIPFETPSVPVDLVDTIGAGDSFTAGLLHRLSELGELGGRLTELSEESARDAVQYAAQVAAITCSRPGANPPWAYEMEQVAGSEYEQE